MIFARLNSRTTIINFVIPLKPKFYRRFVDDTYRRRRKNQPDVLFDKLNSYHPNIKFTLEINPTKFLDTHINRENNRVTYNVYPKESKLPFHWTSSVPKNYKRNIILGELHRASKISSDFDPELKRIKSKFRNSGYPPRFVDSVIRSFNSEKFEPIIPQWMFEERKALYFQIPFCPKNEKVIRAIINKLEAFTNDRVKFVYYWKTRKVRSLFPLKDKLVQQCNVIYKGVCSCGDSYIGETKRNSEVRWKEHCSGKGNSEVANHLLLNNNHIFTWEILSKAPINTNKRKILEVYYIRKFKPTLNDQLDIRFIQLFRNGIT